MRRQLPPIFAYIVLVSGLIFPPLSPYTSVYVVMGVAIATLWLLTPNNFHLLTSPIVTPLMLALCALLLAFFLTGADSKNLGIFYALAPLLIVISVTGLLRCWGQSTLPIIVAVLCLIGSIGAVGLALNDVLVLHEYRAGGSNNPIHFAALSLILGYFSVIGVFFEKSNLRFIFLLGPVLGTISAVMSGSRGPTVAAVMLFTIVGSVLSAQFYRSRTFQILALTILLSVWGITQALENSQMERAESIYATVTSVLQGETALVDSATNTRMQLYFASYQAFLHSPLFGYGSGNMMESVRAYLPDQYKSDADYDHLHSDLADFMVSGGFLGLVAYLSILVAPFFAAYGVPKGKMRRSILAGALILSVGYFILGLTNAMFGILPQTALYGLLLGVLSSMRNMTATEDTP